MEWAGQRSTCPDPSDICHLGHSRGRAASGEWPVFLPTTGTHHAQDLTRRALIVIDVQNEYVSGRLRIEFPPLEDSLRHIADAMAVAASNGIPIVTVQQTAPPDAPLFAQGSEGGNSTR